MLPHHVDHCCLVASSLVYVLSHLGHCTCCNTLHAHPHVTGHVYYYLEDVYPRISGRRPLTTPGVLKALFPGEARAQPAIRPLVEQEGRQE